MAWLLLGNGTSECYYFHENCFLVGTLGKACLQGSDLLVQQHFRWVQLRWDCEPIQGLLQRFLRRKVMNKVTSRSRHLPRREGDFRPGVPRTVWPRLGSSVSLAGLSASKGCGTHNSFLTEPKTRTWGWVFLFHY